MIGGSTKEESRNHPDHLYLQIDGNTLKKTQLNWGKALPMRGGGGSLPHGPQSPEFSESLTLDMVQKSPRKNLTFYGASAFKDKRKSEVLPNIQAMIAGNVDFMRTNGFKGNKVVF